jgi:hypothetical protein
MTLAKSKTPYYFCAKKNKYYGKFSAWHTEF